VKSLRPTHHSLHWVMDMTFRDDECRIRTENAPENVVTLKHMALNLARRKKGRDSVRLDAFVAETVSRR
jgi:predicted transposase YbfD/YdcC